MIIVDSCLFRRGGWLSICFMLLRFMMDYLFIFSLRLSMCLSQRLCRQSVFFNVFVDWFVSVSGYVCCFISHCVCRLQFCFHHCVHRVITDALLWLCICLCVTPPHYLFVYVMIIAMFVVFTQGVGLYVCGEFIFLS